MLHSWFITSQRRGSDFRSNVDRDSILRDTVPNCWTLRWATFSLRMEAATTQNATLYFSHLILLTSRYVELRIDLDSQQNTLMDTPLAQPGHSMN